MDAYVISQIYANALNNDIHANGMSCKEIRSAIQVMVTVYKPGSTSFQSKIPLNANFNHVAYRCAYLHKYAPLHTYIVYDVMRQILKQDVLLFPNLIKSQNFEFCCLGGGPGSDVIGVLAALCTEYNSCKFSATIVDSKQEWQSTFRSVLSELIAVNYLTNIATHFRWKYIGSDLLDGLTNEVKASIASSSLVTMIKFLSAAVCETTGKMVEVIFRVMKPGSLLLFIDNAGGGFSQLIQKVSEENGFLLRFGLRHVHYREEIFNVKRFGHPGCCDTTVTIFLLQKPLNPHPNRSFACSNSNADVADEMTSLLPGKKMKTASQRKSKSDCYPKSNEKQMMGKTSYSKPLPEIKNISNFPDSLPHRNSYSASKNSKSPPSNKPACTNIATFQTSSCSTQLTPTGNLKSLSVPKLHPQAEANKLNHRFDNNNQIYSQAISYQRKSTSPLTTQPISDTGLKSNAESKQDTPQEAIVCSTSARPLPGFKQPITFKLPVQDQPLNMNLREENTRTLSLPKKKQISATRQNYWQRETKISSNSSSSDIIVTNDTRCNAKERTSISPIATLPISTKENSCKDVALHKTTVPENSAIANKPVTISRSVNTAFSIISEKNVVIENVASSETSSDKLKKPNSRYLSIREKGISGNSPGKHTTMPSIHKSKENKLFENRLQEVKNCSSTISTLNNETRHETALQVRGISQNQIINNNSSITTQPACIVNRNYGTLPLPMPMPYTPERGIDDPEDICCPCCTSSYS